MSLQDFRRLCEGQGITGSFEIARYAAFLLLFREKWASWRGRTFSALHNELTQAHQQLQHVHPGLQYVPSPLTPMLHKMELIAPFIEALEEALSSSQYSSSLGEFFQHEVRFQLLKDTSGNQYPTPYHIANLMAALAVTPRSMGVVDPAVGTGGLLAAAAGISSGCDILGCDFDRNMSELASANMLLHDYQNADIRLESALALWDIPAYRDNFDAVVMNPPFSGSRSVDETRHTVGERFGTSTVNVMTALAFKLLRAGGRAALLVPSGLLFGGGANARLRGFLAQHRLEESYQ
jgi:type I restriction enzyme M protein